MGLPSQQGKQGQEHNAHNAAGRKGVERQPSRGAQTRGRASAEADDAGVVRTWQGSCTDPEDTAPREGSGVGRYGVT